MKSRAVASSRERILNATLELMAERGYAGTTLAMITERSGMPSSSTYYHFGSKELLATAVVEHAARQWLAALPRWDSMRGEPAAKLRAMLAASEEAGKVSSQPFLRLLLLLSLELDRSNVEAFEIIARVRRGAASGLRVALTEIYDPRTARQRQLCDDLAMFAVSVIDGAVIADHIHDEYSISQTLDFLFTALMSIGQRHGLVLAGAA
jgi:AcrR family transcriptional regulator